MSGPTSGKTLVVSVFAIAVTLDATGCGNSRTCGSCNGTGMVTMVDSWSGQWATVQCPQCGGTGQVTAKKTFGGPFGWLFGLLQSWGVPGGIAVVVVIALAIYMDSQRSRNIDEERRKNG